MEMARDSSQPEVNALNWIFPGEVINTHITVVLIIIGPKEKKYTY